MRKLLALAAILVLLAVAAGWWTGRRIGRLPAWYLEAESAGRLEPDLEDAARRAQESLVGRFGRELLDEVTADDGTPDESFLDRVKRRGKMVLEGLREGREVRLDGRDLEGLILSLAYQHERGRELLAATRAVRAEFLGAELELGAVVTPAGLPAHALTAGQRRLLTLAQRLSGPEGDLYVALRAVPRAVDDRLVLGPPIDLRIGDLELGAELLSALGLEAPGLETGLALDVGRLRVRQAAIEGEILVLVVSPEI